MDLVYDVEVFKENSLVVFKDMEGKTVRIFSSSMDGLGEYLEKGVLKGEGFEDLEEFLKDKILIGFNNYHYDDYILYAMSKNLPQKIIKEWNDSIINNRSTIGMKKIEVCPTLDCFQQIDVSRPSLKKIEGNMGSSIVESEVSFNIDRKLTPSENLETVKYCEYDTLQTLTIWNMRGEYFKSKMEILEMVEPKDLARKAYKWNTTSIVGHILRPKYRAPSRRLVSDEMLSHVPYEVQDMWRQLDSTIDFDFKTKKVIVEEFGNVIEFGWGGLHGAPPRTIIRTDVKLADVESMYPNILILLDGLGDKTSYYKNLLEHRLELKKAGKKAEQAPYKLILNSTYGLLNNQYSALNNPHLAYSICIYGQISLYVLSKRLAGIGAEIININTDGVAYIYKGDGDCQILKEWEEEFALKLAEEHFTTWIQTNVNNYIAVADDGYVITKGGDVNKYFNNMFFSNNDIRVTHIALVDYLTKGVPIETTLHKNLNNPLLYQYILQAGSTYKGVVTADDNDTVLETKVHRVFAVKDGVQLLKKREDGGTVKFANAPDNMLIWNGDIEDLKDFDKVVDLQWYYDLTQSALKRWREE